MTVLFSRLRKQIQATCIAMALLAATDPVRAASETVVYSFKGGRGIGSDGAHPAGGLIDVDGLLYGTTSDGGAGRVGTVFKVTTAGVETVVSSFGCQRDGGSPTANLISVGGKLYGTNSICGANNGGTVFKVTAAGVAKGLYFFHIGDGASPIAGLIKLGGSLYGTTLKGGASGDGTIFGVTKAGVEKVVYSFRGGSDGSGPEGALIGAGGTFFGTTTYGGGSGCGQDFGCGTVFSVTAAEVRVVVVFLQGWQRWSQSLWRHDQRGRLALWDRFKRR